MMTYSGAYGMGLEKVTGSIEPGKCADFIVLNQNILEVPVEKIHKTKVLKTVLRGHTVYEAR
jgi:predicted amidohydrolase YtcJ